MPWSSACRESSAFLPERRAFALFGQRAFEPGAVHVDAVFGRQLDREIDRETERVMKAERDVAGQDRRIGRQVLGAATDDTFRRRERDEGLLEVDQARVEGSGELGLLAPDRGKDSLAVLVEVRICLAHDVDHDLSRSRRETARGDRAIARDGRRGAGSCGERIRGPRSRAGRRRR